jgi:hypothetical protein
LQARYTLERAIHPEDALFVAHQHQRGDVTLRLPRCRQVHVDHAVPDVGPGAQVVEKAIAARVVNHAVARKYERRRPVHAQRLTHEMRGFDRNRSAAQLSPRVQVEDVTAVDTRYGSEQLQGRGDLARTRKHAPRAQRHRHLLAQ